MRGQAMEPERRFHGTMSEQYTLVRLAIPDFDELQGLVAVQAARHDLEILSSRNRFSIASRIKG